MIIPYKDKKNRIIKYCNITKYGIYHYMWLQQYITFCHTYISICLEWNSEPFPPLPVVSDYKNNMRLVLFYK